MPLFVTPTPLDPNILKSALPVVSSALLPAPVSVVIVTPVISPLPPPKEEFVVTLPSESTTRALVSEDVPKFSK